MACVDVLVAGQGIAGTLLARELLLQGLEVHVADPEISPTSSQVAAGLMHPLVPRTGGLTWRAAELFPASAHYYRALEAATGQVFFHAMPMAFLADTAQDRQHWTRAAEQLGPQWLEWMEELPELHGRSGALTRQSGRLDMAALCRYHRALWTGQGRFSNEAVLWNALHFEQGYWFWRDIKAKYVVFAQGAFAYEQQPLESLPFHLTRGELLSIRLSDPSGLPSYIVKKKVFSIPLGSGVFRIGSTYDWKNLIPEPTESGRATLLQQLSELLPQSLSYEILAHETAVRPTVGRRRPYMGPHPEHRQLYICNGWGSKGASMGPLLVKELIACMLQGKPVHPETDPVLYWNT